LQFGLAVAEVGDLAAEGADSLAAVGFGQGAGFEGEQVAFDGLLGLVEFGLDVGEVAALALCGGVCAGGGIVGDAVEQVGAFVGGEQRVEDGDVELARWQPVGGAGVGAVALREKQV